MKILALDRSFCLLVRMTGPIMDSYPMAGAAIDPTGLREGRDERRRIALPADTTGDRVIGMTADVSLWRVLLGEMPERLEDAHGAPAFDAEDGGQGVGLRMLRRAALHSASFGLQRRHVPSVSF